MAWLQAEFLAKIRLTHNANTRPQWIVCNKIEEWIDPKNDVRSRIKLFEHIDWTDTLFTETWTQTIDEILVEWHNNINGRQKWNSGVKMNFECKLRSENNKVVFIQKVPMPVQVEQDLIDNLALTHKCGVLKLLPFFKYAVPIFEPNKPNGYYVYFWSSEHSVATQQ